MLTQRQFDAIRHLVKDRTGIVLTEGKQIMVHRRLDRRLKELGLTGFDQYLERLVGPQAEGEIRYVLNALTTNHTGFFRESHHFEHLASTIGKAPGSNPGRLRIWSAGCSSGEESYSIAMTLFQSLTAHDRRNLRILATDIDTQMIARAKAGAYDAQAIAAIPPGHRQAFVEALPQDSGRYRMSDALRSLIVFNPLNLLGPWPMKGPFDAIFCRNVVIYFDKPTQRVLFDRFADYLRDEGILYIGHSETLFNVSQRFESLGRSTYRKQS